LAVSGEFEPLFAEFEGARRLRTAKISSWPQTMKPAKRVNGPFGCWLRDRMLSIVLPLFGERSLDWMYNYQNLLDCRDG